MARKRTRGRRGPRTRLHGSSRTSDVVSGTDDLGPPPLHDVREALDERHPLTLLAVASSLLQVLEPARPGPLPTDDDTDEPDLPSVRELVESFIEIDTIETTALLAAFAEYVDDEVLARRMRRAVAARTHHRLPRWLTELSPIDVHTAVELSHVLRDGDNVMLGVRTAAGAEMTVAVYIDHNLGTVVKDAFVMDEAVDAAVAQFVATAGDDPDVTRRDLALADARARIDAAMELAAILWPPLETDSWPACRPLVRWVVRQLPSGGQGYVRPEWSDAERAVLAERFFASPFGRDEDDDDGRSLFESLLWFGCDYGPGDPLRWSPVAVEILLSDWLPRKVVADVAFLSRAPDLLRAFVRYSHAERGIREELTAETLAAVDEYEDEYQEVIRSPRPQGPAALMAAMGVPVGDGPFGADVMPWWADASYEELALDTLAREVGGSGQLQSLDTAPLPDEAFAWEAIDDDIADRVGAVLALTDRCCDELLDVEYRTACRRLLAEVAVADPQIFRRRARAETAAAAVAWIIGKANGLFRTYRTDVAVADIVGWFGVSGSPSQRASTMLRALGIDGDAYAGIALGSPRYLVSPYRRELAARRDQLSASLDSIDDDLALPPIGGIGLQRPHEPLPDRDGPFDPRQPADVVTAVGWFPRDQFTAALQRWPDLTDRWDTDDYAAYAAAIQGHLMEIAQAAGRNPQLVPLRIADLVTYAEQHGVDPGDPATRAAFAADVASRGEAVGWPPRRNDRCWCGSGRKYKKCCDGAADPAGRAFDR